MVQPSLFPHMDVSTTLPFGFTQEVFREFRGGLFKTDQQVMGNLVTVPETCLFKRGDAVRRLKVGHGELDINDVFGGEPGDRGRADVIDPQYQAANN